MNICMEYLYRDAGNYKNWGAVVFSNPGNISAKMAEKMANDALIDQSYFVAEKIGVPDLHFSSYNAELDHNWHEFYAFSETDVAADDRHGRSVEELIQYIKAMTANEADEKCFAVPQVTCR